MSGKVPVEGEGEGTGRGASSPLHTGRVGEQCSLWRSPSRTSRGGNGESHLAPSLPSGWLWYHHPCSHWLEAALMGGCSRCSCMSLQDVCHHLPPPATISHRLPPPATAGHHLPAHAIARSRDSCPLRKVCMAQSALWGFIQQIHHSWWFWCRVLEQCFHSGVLSKQVHI